MSIWASWDDIPALTYRRSHHYPSADDPPACVDTAYITGHATGQIEEEPYAPFLRLGVADDDLEGHVVVLPADSVRALRDRLADWLDRLEDA